MTTWQTAIPKSSLEAREAGISVVNQEFPQCEHAVEHYFWVLNLGGRGFLSK